ncbi:sensor domain-containing phosphodiesterase [Arenibaculum pallidiluteum]|uniref:sensor domain-containing phosphodiesterase n=1 Tax=Arenibaculum pallidiluteum TaxID=2812559 RepID=UPI001A96469E|nr:EAL domain-containing protein [Arenibaculum pallidiluteum]
MVGRPSAALGALARHDSFARQDREASLRAITETAVDVLGVAQASVWMYRPASGVLECSDLFSAAGRLHERGPSLLDAEHPAYFAALKEARLVATAAPRTDPRTASLESYLTSRGVTALIDAPVLLQGQVVGVVCCEQTGGPRAWTPEDIAFVGSLADFVAVALAGEERRRSEERLNLAFSVMRAGIWDHDATTGEIWWSPEYYRLLGLAPELPATAALFESLIHPDDREGVAEMYRRHMAGEIPVLRQSYRMRRTDGSWIWVEDFGRAVLDADGRPVRWIGIKTDVSDSVRREEEKREAEARYRSLFENAVEGLWRIGRDGRLAEANPALAEILGFDGPAQLLKRLGRPRQLFADAGRWHELKRLIEQQDRVLGHEAELVRRDGQHVWVSLNLRVVRDAQSGIVAVEGSAEDITHLKRAKAQLDHATMHDGLTNLPNRYLFVDRVGQALARQRLGALGGTAVILIDYDDLKLINDSLGHAVGDAMLVELGQRLQTALRPGDTLARLGSDEFAVLAEGLSDPGVGRLLADALRSAVSAPFALNGHEIFPSICLGIAVDDGERQDAEDLLRDAGIALHEAKSQGRGQTAMFAPAMRSEPLAVLRLQSELRRAIERDEFMLYYQPVLELPSRTLLGFEALVRWRHPTRGLVSPALFIPIAEDAGLMPELGHWVMRQAFAQLAEWSSRIPADCPFSLSINMAPSQVATPDLFQTLDRLIAQTGAPVDRLRIEVTETAFDGDADLVASRLRTLRERGFGIVIDDFGTGYSSLGRLHRFPIDALKIDQSFVRPMLVDPDCAAIVRSVIALGHALGLGVIAEGVEDERCARELLRLGCTSAQGYLFAKPQPADIAEAFVQSLPRAGGARAAAV